MKTKNNTTTCLSFKRLLATALTLLASCTMSFNAKAQVTVTGCTGAGNGSYATLSAAATAIVAAQPSATITVTISGNTTEPVGGATLVAGTWTSLTILPSGGSWTISGAITAGTPLLTLNGSDNVKIDGLNSGGNALTISNTTFSVTSGTSTIKLQADATTNTITNCSILGSGSMAVGTNGGNIWISTGTTTGNDNNVISFCNIGPAGSNLPSKGIYGNGSTTTTAIGNSGNLIDNNNIFDVFGAAVTSAGITTQGGCNTWTITNNKFYQTGTRTWTTGAQHSAIWLTPSTATSGVQAFTVTGNIIGYASNSQTGTYTLTGSTGIFRGIFFSGITGGTLSTISSNTITAVSLTGVTSSGTTTSSPFTGIMISSGTATCSSNILGSQTTTGALVFSTTTTSSTDIYGLLNFGSDAWISNGNLIGGLTVTNAAASGTFFVYGIRGWTGSTVTWTANSNIIGGIVANSIQLNFASTGASLVGINNNSAIVTMSGNTVRNLTTTSTNIGSGSSCAIIGISQTGTTTTALQTVTSNTVHTLSLSTSNTASAIQITGIFMAGGTSFTNIVSKNSIHSFTASAVNPFMVMTGIDIASGTANYINNMVRLGLNPDGTSLTTALTIRGITLGVSNTNNFYFNSVFIGGTGVGTTANHTRAFNMSTAGTRDIRNNIFVNNRSNASTGGKHYSLFLVSNTGSTLNYNIYGATGTGGTHATINNGSSDVAYGSGWVAGDVNSWSNDPQFLTPSGSASTGDLHINPSVATPVEGKGVNIASVTDDFDGQSRASFTPEDIGADAGNFTALPLCTGTPASATINGAAAVCSGSGTTLSLSTSYTDIGITYQWGSSTTSGGTVTNMGIIATQVTGNLTVPMYYTCTITCTNSGFSYTTVEKDVQVNALPTVTVTPSSGSYCTPGGSAVALTAGGASTYTWLPATGLSAVNIANPNATPSATTTYTVTGTDGNGCVNTATAAVTVATSPQGLTATATPPSICAGGTSNLTSSAYAPTSTTVNNYTFATSIGATLDAMAGATTVVSASTDDAPMNTSVGVNTTPGNSIALPFAFNYNGSNFTFFSASPDGWVVLSNSSLAATASFTNSITLTTNSPKIAPYWDDLATGTDGWVKTVTTGLSPNRIFKIEWKVTIPRATTGASNSTFQLWMYETTNVIEFRYGTMGTPSSGSISGGLCGSATQFHSLTYSTNTSSTVTANDVITTAPSSGRMYSYASPSATLSYSWALAGDVVSSSSQNTLTNALSSSETFTVTATNSGCSATATTGVSAGSALVCGAITTSPSLCAGSTYTLTSNTSGGGAPYSYSWSNGATTANITDNQAAGTYSYTVTVSDVCSNVCTSTVTVTVNGLPSVSVAPTPGTARICGTGTVALLASGANTYLWSPSTALTSSVVANPTSSATVTTTYNVTGTDANGCVSTSSQTVTVGPVVTVNSTSATPAGVCSGSSSALTATASTSPALNYTVASITPSAETPSGSPTVLATGGVSTPAVQGTFGLDDGYWDGITLPFAFNFYGVSYSTVRVGTNGNVQFGAVASAGRNPGNGSFTPQTIPTAGGFLDNFIAGPWMDQDPSTTPFGTIRYFTNGVSPNRKFVVSFEAVHVFNSADNNTSQIILNENGTIDVLLLGGGLVATTLKAIGIENATGSLGVAAPGRNAVSWTTAADEAWRFTPAALNYSWADGTGFTPSALVSNPTTPALSASTTYTVTATETTSGCFGTATRTVNVSQPMSLSTNGSPVSCNGGTNGSASVTINSGGVSPYTYLWNNGATGSTATGLSAGTYSVTVTDSYSCTATSSFTVTQPTALFAGSSAGSILCNGGTTTVTVTATGGTSPYSGTGVFTVSAGAFTYTVTDANGCSSVTSGSVSEPTALSAGSSAGSILCNGGTTTVTVTATGGTSPYSGTGVFTVSAGAFTYTVTDANGCSSVTSGSVSEPTALSAGSSSGSILCNGGTTTVTVTATGGTSPYSGTGLFTVSAGAFTYTVTDANGCSSVTSGSVSEPTALSAGSSAGSILCNGGTTTVTVTATGGTSPYSGTGVFTVSAGTFTYTVTDANGCSSVTSGSVSEPAVLTASSVPALSTICNGGTTTVSVTATGGTSPYSGTGVFNVSGGAFTYTVTDANGCTAVTSGSVAVTQPNIAPTSLNTSATVVCILSNTVTLTQTGGSLGTGATWAWYKGSISPANLVGTSIVANAMLVITPTVTATYLLRAEGATTPCTVNTTAPGSVSVSVTNAAPIRPSAVSGPQNLCPFTGGGTATFTATAVSGATSYKWTLLPGMTSTGGNVLSVVSNTVTTSNNFLSVTVNQAFFVNGVIVVLASNACGDSPSQQSLSLTLLPATPGTITGPASVCFNVPTNVVYSVANITSAYGVALPYNWSVPSGMSVVSGNGSTAITVAVTPNSPIAGNVTVYTENPCGLSAAAGSKAVNSTAGTLGAISGNDNICANIASATPVTYSVAPLATANSYIWSVPAGASIVSPNGGTSVSVLFTTAFAAKAQISVFATNGCKNTATVLMWIYKIPNTPVSISVIGSNCTSGAQFTTAAVNGATSYNWTVPAGLCIVGGQSCTKFTTTTNTISTTKTGAVSGSVTVSAVNSCGISTARTLAITCASPIFTQGDESEKTIVTNLYPNPTVGNFTIEISTEVNRELVIEVYDVLGNVVLNEKQNILVGTSSINANIEGMKNGLYFVRVLDTENKLVYSNTLIKQ